MRSTTCAVRITNALSTYLAKQAQMIRHAARVSSRRRLPLSARHRVREPGTPDRVTLDASPLNHSSSAVLSEIWLLRVVEMKAALLLARCKGVGRWVRDPRRQAAQSLDR